MARQRAAATSTVPPPAELRAMATSLIIERMQLMRRAGVSFDGKRDLYSTLGYPRSIAPIEYRERYERGGIAGRIVDAYPDATWRGEGDLVENDDPEDVTEFEMAWMSLKQKHKLWSVLKRLDKLSAMGQYAVLLIGAPGDLSTPLLKAKRPEDLLFFSPFSEEDAQPEAWVTSPSDPRFGQISMYKIKRMDMSMPKDFKMVHWTRVHHVADLVLDNEVTGMPRLQRVWNLLDDLDKVTGGGAEAFWLRANQGLQLDIDKDMKLSTDAKEALKDEVEKYVHQMQRVMRTKGVKATTLGSQVADFSGAAEAIYTQIAGSIAIPKRLLMGSEMGQLASGQDADNWNTQVQDRRDSHAAPNVLRPLIDRLIEYNFLPKPTQYGVVWPTEANLTEDEKAKGAKAWADTVTDEGPCFTRDEIRDHWYGMDPYQEPTDGSALLAAAAGKKRRARSVVLVHSAPSFVPRSARSSNQSR